MISNLVTITTNYFLFHDFLVVHSMNDFVYGVNLNDFVYGVNLYFAFATKTFCSHSHSNPVTKFEEKKTYKYQKMS